MRSYHRWRQHRQIAVGKCQGDRPRQVESLGEASLFVRPLREEVALELIGKIDECEIDGTQSLDADKFRELAHLLRPGE